MRVVRKLLLAAVALLTCAQAHAGVRCGFATGDGIVNISLVGVAGGEHFATFAEGWNGRMISPTADRRPGWLFKSDESDKNGGSGDDMWTFTSADNPRRRITFNAGFGSVLIEARDPLVLTYAAELADDNGVHHGVCQIVNGV
jgi:hypothetical protein